MNPNSKAKATFTSPLLRSSKKVPHGLKDCENKIKGVVFFTSISQCLGAALNTCENKIKGVGYKIKSEDSWDIIK